MRRLAVVAAPVAGRSERELDSTFEWLATLPTGGVARFERLADVPLELTDVLWARNAADPGPEFLGWLERGGRLLATHAATLLPAALGLEREPPMPVETPEPLPPAFGLAGFGFHPLFSGLRDGALLVPCAEDGPGRLFCYDGGRRPAAAVVAVERHGLEVHPARILAWEQPVGTGGVLCLGFAPALNDTRPGVSRREAEVVLANALVGDAIPHDDRVAPVALWPVPGRRTAGTESPAPVLTAPSDVWPGTSLPVLDLTPASEWTHAGRRLLVRARPATGHREVWAPPFRIMHDAAVRDAIPCAPGHMAPDEVAGGLALGGHRLLERWMAAPDVPVVVWEVGGHDGVELVAAWEVDLRRAWPYPAGAYGDLRYTVAADGHSLGVEAAAGPLVRFGVTGGRLSVAHASADTPEDPVVRVSCAGATPLRIVAAAGADPEELQRALRVLERSGIRGLAEARAGKAAQLERYGTAFEAPDERLTRAFAWARLRGDEALVGVPGIGRSVLAVCPRGAEDGAWCFGTQACAAAAAQLIAGNRDPARELLKFLAQTQHPDGGIAAHVPLGGLASGPDGASTVAFLELGERLLAWTGEVEALRRHGEAFAAALRFLAGAGGPAPSERVLDAMETTLERGVPAAVIATLRQERAERRPTAEVAAHAVVEAAAAALRRAPGALPGTGAAPALLESVAALWGLEPDAADAALALAPAVPAGWDGLALRRLRVGRTLLDVEVRRRPETIVLRAAHRFGPRLVLTVGVRGADVAGIEVDDVTLPGARARFEAHERHEVRFLLRG